MGIKWFSMSYYTQYIVIFLHLAKDNTNEKNAVLCFCWTINYISFLADIKFIDTRKYKSNKLF